MAIEYNKNELSKRFKKGDLENNQLPFIAKQWATLTDKQTGLMWVNNWNADDTFPVRRVTWFKTGDKYCEENYDRTWSHGYNTENWLATINHYGWSGHNDWRLPSNNELKTLVINKINEEYEDWGIEDLEFVFCYDVAKQEFRTYPHRKPYEYFDIDSYNQLFCEYNKNEIFWSLTDDLKYDRGVDGMDFERGSEIGVAKFMRYPMRVVRSI